jgi:hypothetical protein
MAMNELNQWEGGAAWNEGSDQLGLISAIDKALVDDRMDYCTRGRCRRR